MIHELRSLDPEIRDNTGLSPLHVAATMPHSAALRAMLDVFYSSSSSSSSSSRGHRPYDINHVSGAGDSALHVCCLEGDADKVRLMLRRGADLEKRGSNSYTLLHRLVQVRRRPFSSYFGDGGCGQYSSLYRLTCGSSWWIGLGVGSLLPLFYIHRMN